MDVAFTSKLPKVSTSIFSVMSSLANEHQAINLSQGFPNFDCHEELKKLVAKYIKDGYNQYAPMPGVPILRERIAQKIEGEYGAKVDPNTEITITAGATQAIFTAISTFIKQDDEVILIEPAYDSYRPVVQLCGGRAISYELSAPNYQIDWDHFRKLLNRHTKMIVINTPQNPSATTLSEADMKQLERLTANTDTLILSDEVYGHLIFDDEQHQSVLRFPNLFQRSLITYSFGKTFHATGWKTGYCVAPSYLMKEFRKVHQFNVFSVNAPVQYAIAEFLQEPSHYQNLPQFFQAKRDFFKEAMKDSRFKLLPSKGTYFQLADFSAISDESDVEFAKRLTTEYGVAAIPVSVFFTSKKDEKVIRFCFAKTEEMLAEAGKLLCRI